MSTWRAARNAGQSARNNQLADAAGGVGDGGKASLKRYLDGKFPRYKMADQCCFFCGARGHHTGYLSGYGGIWLCRSRCEDRYSETVRDL